jgi:hypothetical protein
MSQHDLVIDNQAFPATRADINAGLQALGTLQSGASAPGTTYAYELWLDTSTSPATLRQRNAANSAWIALWQVDLTGTPGLTFANKMLGKGFDVDAITSIGSASTTDIGAAATSEVLITGTTTINGFGAAAAGIRRRGRFAGVLTLVHSSAILLPGLANIATAADDTFEALSLGGGNWRVTSYQRASAAPAVGNLVGFGDRLINGGFLVDQYGSTGTGDDLYFIDRWYSLTQTTNVGCSREIDPEVGTFVACRLNQTSVTAQRMGLAQIIESGNCKDLRSAACVFSGRLRSSASITVRYAILEWTGTADVVTSDVVNNWTSGVFTPGNFFIGTSLAVVATGSVSLTANTWLAFNVTGTPSSSMNNLIVMMWTDAAAAQSVTLDFARLKFERGSSPTTYDPRNIGEEFELCMRYYHSSAGNNGWIYCPAPAPTFANSMRFGFPIPMRANPTVSFGVASSNALTSATLLFQSFQHFDVIVVANANTNAYAQINWTARAEL